MHFGHLEKMTEQSLGGNFLRSPCFEEAMDIVLLKFGGKLYNKLIILRCANHYDLVRACNTLRKRGYKIHHITRMTINYPY